MASKIIFELHKMVLTNEFQVVSCVKTLAKLLFSI